MGLTQPRPLGELRMNKIICRLLVLAGVCMLIYPLWAETNAYIEQHRLSRLQNTAQLSLFRPESNISKKPAAFGSALLEIPDIKLSVRVAPGTSPAQLRNSPGWYENSALPGQGNTCIAAHRTTYGAWFRHLDRLQKGDVIYLTWAGMVFEYRVIEVVIVDDEDSEVLEPLESSALTLTTCQGSKKRLVVKSLLI